MCAIEKHILMEERKHNLAEVGDLQQMLHYLLAEDGDMRPFVAGQFCPATKEGSPRSLNLVRNV